MLSVSALTRPPLRPVSFDLAEGECIALRGPSGSGKSLLLRAIADLDPNEGSVSLEGRPREAMPAPHWRRQVTYVAAEPGWWADTVGGHFADWPAALSLIEELGIVASCHTWPVARLSTGERQRLALVRALLLKPRVLLLDEPTSGLDPDTTASVERLVSRELANGAATLWVTHDIAQARRVAQRFFLARDGQVWEQPP